MTLALSHLATVAQVNTRQGREDVTRNSCW